MGTIQIKCEGASEVSIEKLFDFQGNLKVLSDENYQKLKNEILDLGFSEPISVWDDGEKLNTLNGHQRCLTIRKMIEEGFDCPLLPINFVEADSIEQAHRKVLALTSQYGEVTEEGLKQEAERAGYSIIDLQTRLRMPEIDFSSFEKLFQPKDDPELEDAVPTVPKALYIKLGDRFELGNHVLLCGDSTDPCAVDLLMMGEKADMVFTDPPYGIAYENTKGGIMGDGSLDVFRDSCSLLPSLVKEKTHAYIFFGVQLASESLTILNGLFKQYNLLVMPITHQNKPGPEGYFNSNYEICYFTNIGGVKKHYPGAGSVSESTLNDSRYKGSGLLERYRALNEHIITEHNLKTVHPTEKKVSGIEFYLSISSKLKDMVLDLFGGSGSTLIACEKTNRKCFMMELDPYYCSVILERYLNYCGKEPVRCSDGLTWSQIKANPPIQS